MWKHNPLIDGFQSFLDKSSEVVDKQSVPKHFQPSSNHMAILEGGRAARLTSVCAEIAQL